MIETHFSPGGGIAARLAALIDGASKSVLVQAYTFTSKTICDALVAKAGLVTFIGDARGMDGPGCLIGSLHAAGIPCWLDAKHAIAHNKVIVIDSEVVVTGSYNFTVSAELHNAENCVVITDPGIAKAFEDNFNVHLRHSTPYPYLARFAYPVLENELTQQ